MVVSDVLILLMFCGSSSGCLGLVLLCVFVLFSDHAHLILEAMAMKIIDSIALF